MMENFIKFVHFHFFFFILYLVIYADERFQGQK